MTREEAKAILYEWQKMMVRNGVPLDTSKVQALRVAIEALSEKHQLSAETPTNTPTDTPTDLISRADAIEAVADVFAPTPTEAYIRSNCIDALSALPSARPTGWWERLMMYLADLQLTYSPNWGANGCGDEKLYEFVTGLIEELEGWEDGGGA